MRRRLLIALLALAGCAIIGFAYPLLTSTADDQTKRLLMDRLAVLDRFGELAHRSIFTNDTSDLAEAVKSYTDLYSEELLVLDQHGRPIVGAGTITVNDPGLEPLIEATLSNQPIDDLPQLRPWSSDQVVLTHPVGSDTQIVGAVVLRFSVTTAAEKLARQWLVITLGALGAAATSVILATVVAHWVLRPLAQLEHGVREVAAGREGTRIPDSDGPPELRALSTSFNLMSHAVRTARDNQRQLVADASHQLRNPMAALRLRLDSLAPIVTSGAQSTYQSLATEVDRLERLLDGLLTLASADELATRLHPDDGIRCYPDSVARDRFRAWQAAADSADVRLEHHLPADHEAVGPIRCTESELAQILDVLLDNAIRYSGAGATVRIRGERQAAEAILIVEDSGPGMSPEEQVKATQRFWRAPNSSDSPGTGLGLAIAERLITARAGQLRILSREPSGLKVHVTFPRAEPREPRQ